MQIFENGDSMHMLYCQHVDFTVISPYDNNVRSIV